MIVGHNLEISDKRAETVARMFRFSIVEQFSVDLQLVLQYNPRRKIGFLNRDGAGAKRDKQHGNKDETVPLG
jgi:hypothetical protein